MQRSRKKSRPRVKVRQIVNHWFVVTIAAPPIARAPWLARKYCNVALWLASVFFQLIRLYLW